MAASSTAITRAGITRRGLSRYRPADTLTRASYNRDLVCQAPDRVRVLPIFLTATWTNSRGRSES